MTTINLRDYYPFYKEDTFIEISDEIAEQLQRFVLDDEAYRIRVLRAKAYYSLDCEDGIEKETIHKPMTPDELLEWEETVRLLHEAMALLSRKQAKRVYAHAVLGKSKSEIAKDESIKTSSVSESIERGLKNLRKILKEFF